MPEPHPPFSLYHHHPNIPTLLAMDGLSYPSYYAQEELSSAPPTRRPFVALENVPYRRPPRRTRLPTIRHEPLKHVPGPAKKASFGPGMPPTPPLEHIALQLLRHTQPLLQPNRILQEPPSQNKLTVTKRRSRPRRSRRSAVRARRPPARATDWIDFHISCVTGEAPSTLPTLKPARQSPPKSSNMFPELNDLGGTVDDFLGMMENAGRFAEQNVGDWDRLAQELESFYRGSVVVADILDSNLPPPSDAVVESKVDVIHLSSDDKEPLLGLFGEHLSKKSTGMEDIIDLSEDTPPSRNPASLAGLVSHAARNDVQRRLASSIISSAPRSRFSRNNAQRRLASSTTSSVPGSRLSCGQYGTSYKPTWKRVRDSDGHEHGVCDDCWSSIIESKRVVL
ncbi:hypothetical protein C8F01DRAFT_501532 [Mycena amicta]|nr:hypothetical protein C8F01DRAFT_501532 [Mycena amicta]